jgi:hypothetical protein
VDGWFGIDLFSLLVDVLVQRVLHWIDWRDLEFL